MIKLTDALLQTKLELICPINYKAAFSQAIQVKLWLNNRKAYGIAANQLGINHHFFVVHNAKKWGLPTDVYFNAVYEPENPDEQFMSEETCLSYPGREFIVLRYPKVHLKYYDPRENRQRECFLDGIGAVVVQHEADHLYGITDEISMKLLAEKIENAKKQASEEENKPVEESKS